MSGCAVETQQDAAGTPSAQGTQAAASTAYDPNGEKSLRNFTATDLEGNTVTQDIFKEHQMTMVNVWATYCPTCMEELADLAKLYAENADRNINIVGIVYDAKKSDGSIDEKQVALAKEIVEQTGATYTQLLPSPDLQEAVLGDVTTAVSYTHLDVYKRQGYGWPSCWRPRRAGASWTGRWVSPEP